MRLLGKALDTCSLVGTVVYSCKCILDQSFKDLKKVLVRDVMAKIVIDHELESFLN